jgi:hypothetical protein
VPPSICRAKHGRARRADAVVVGHELQDRDAAARFQRRGGLFQQAIVQVGMSKWWRKFVISAMS